MIENINDEIQKHISCYFYILHTVCSFHYGILMKIQVGLFRAICNYVVDSSLLYY